MTKIDFTRVEAQTSFDGRKQIYNVAQNLGNAMMFNGSVLLDIGFEDLAKEIYYSQGEVEIPEKYKMAIKKVIEEAPFIVTLKRTLIMMLFKKDEE